MKKQRIWASLHPFFEKGGVLGRGVANANFLTALLRADPFAAYHFFLQDTAQVTALQTLLEERFPVLTARGAFRLATRHDLPEALAGTEYACFHLSDYVADTVSLMRLRNAAAMGKNGMGHFFPITGPTHSLSYARFAPFFFEQLWEGVTRKDAMIVTSTAARDAMRRYFDALRAGYALSPETSPNPRLELIPLGVDPAEFPAPEERPALGARLREEMGFGRDELLLLAFARISHYSKMDALPLFRALRRARDMGLPGDGYTLLLAGWVDTHDDLPESYRGLAAKLGIRLRIVPSPSDALRKSLFAAADIFVSPVDNPQETFGLSLLEAGVSSLPIVASDFDGYRDLVRHGENGFLVPTLGPAFTPESDAFSGIRFDNQHHLHIAQQSVVDVPELARAIALLAGNASLRRSMGERGRQRVLASFTWAGCVEKHCALWESLDHEQSPEKAAWAHPLFPAYPAVFGGYYTALLSPEAARGMRVRWSAAGEALYRGRESLVVYAGVERLVGLDDVKRLLFRARKPVPLSDLLPPESESAHPAYEHAAFLVFWALKQDYLERAGA